MVAAIPRNSHLVRLKKQQKSLISVFLGCFTLSVTAFNQFIPFTILFQYCQNLCLLNLNLLCGILVCLSCEETATKENSYTSNNSLCAQCKPDLFSQMARNIAFYVKK